MPSNDGMNQNWIQICIQICSKISEPKYLIISHPREIWFIDDFLTSVDWALSLENYFKEVFCLILVITYPEHNFFVHSLKKHGEVWINRHAEWRQNPLTKALTLKAQQCSRGSVTLPPPTTRRMVFVEQKFFEKKIKTTTLLPSHSLQEKPLPFQYISHEFDISQALSAVCIEH